MDTVAPFLQPSWAYSTSSLDPMAGGSSASPCVMGFTFVAMSTRKVLPLPAWQTEPQEGPSATQP